MKASSGSKTSRNKELNSSRLSLSSTFDNETLAKRLDDIEARHSKFKKSSSQKSISTLNNTFTEAEMLDDFSHIKNQENKNLIIPSFITNEMIEWKKDIEKSLETISERVASYNSNVLVNLIEKRVNDTNNEFTKLKKNFEDNLDNTSIIKRNLEKFDKTEKLISTLLSQMAEMKNNNLKWQADFLKNLNDFNEKMLMQESSIEEMEHFENKVNKKLEHINSELKNFQNDYKFKIQEFDNKLTEKTLAINEGYEYMFNENNRLNNKLRDELMKIERSRSDTNQSHIQTHQGPHQSHMNEINKLDGEIFARKLSHRNQQDDRVSFSEERKNVPKLLNNYIRNVNFYN